MHSSTLRSESDLCVNTRMSSSCTSSSSCRVLHTLDINVVEQDEVALCDEARQQKEEGS